MSHFRLQGKETVCHIAFDRNHRQGVAEEVVKISCDAFAFRLQRETFDLLVGVPQLPTEHLPGEDEIAQAYDHHEEHDGLGDGPGQVQ